MHPAMEIMNWAWPDAQGGNTSKNASSPIGQGRTVDLGPASIDMIEKRRLELIEEKRSVCPRLAVNLSGPVCQVTDNGHITFSASLLYEQLPTGHEIPIVAKVIGNSGGPLGDKAVQYGQYQILTDPSHTQEHIVAHSTTYVTVRRVKGSDGEFLPSPVQTEEISETTGWSDVRVGDNTSRTFKYNLESNKGWEEKLGAWNNILAVFCTSW
jgi:hypothetical protein